MSIQFSGQYKVMERHNSNFRSKSCEEAIQLAEGALPDEVHVQPRYSSDLLTMGAYKVVTFQIPDEYDGDVQKALNNAGVAYSFGEDAPSKLVQTGKKAVTSLLSRLLEKP